MLSAGLKKKIQECPPRSGTAPRGAVPLGTFYPPYTNIDFLKNELILNALAKKFPDFYNQIKLSKNDISTVIEKAKYYYGLGYGFTDWPKFKESIYKVLPKYDKMEIAKILSYITGITKNDFPQAFDLLVNQGKNFISSSLKQRSLDVNKKVDYVKQEVADKLERGGKALKDSFNTAKPFLIIGAIGAGACYLYQKGVFKKREYLQNPIKKSKAEKAVEKYIEFHDRKPSKRIEIEPIETDELIYLGNALEIGYESKKWTGNNENYLHEFGKGVKVYQTLDGKSLVISGGKMRVKSQGITN
jgi:hypothetical protein